MPAELVSRASLIPFFMKTTVLAVTALGLLCGCDLTGSRLAADGDAPRPAPPGENSSFAPSLPSPSLSSPTFTNTSTATNDVAGTPTVAVRELAAPAPPPDLPGPVQQVVRLAQTTLGDGVLLGFVDQIKEPYGLNAEQIIYLNDLGLSESVIKDLIKHSTGAPVGDPASATNAPLAAGRTPVPANNGPAPRNLPANLPGSDIGKTPATPLVQYDTVPPTNYVVAPTAQPATPQVFYDSLSPYGQWVEDPDYGVIWQPTVAVVNPGWQPYCDNGYWVWTDCGWYWSSTYSWGWAPFHYGRWCRASCHGWCWVPDTCWGPAWVTWRTCDSHCGWAPLPPHCAWSPTVGLTFHGSHVGVGFGFGLNYDSYVYVGWSHFCDRRPWQHCAPRSEVVALHSQSRVINDVHGNGNTVVNVHGNNNTVIINNGPGLAPAQAHARTEIPRLTVADAHSPLGNPIPARAGTAPGVVAAYRPVVGNASPTGSTISTRPSTIAAPTATTAPSRPYIGASAARGEIAAKPSPTMVPQPSLAPNAVSRPKTVPRATPIAGVPTGSVHEANPIQAAPRRSEIASTAPVRPSVPAERPPTGIFAPGPESAMRAPVATPARGVTTSQGFPSGARPIAPAASSTPNAPAYRYYNPTGNNAPVVRYYPGAGAPASAPVGPVHGGSSGYSNPSGSVPAPNRGGSGNSGGSGNTSRGTHNGR